MSNMKLEAAAKMLQAPEERPSEKAVCMICVQEHVLKCTALQLSDKSLVFIQTLTTGRHPSNPRCGRRRSMVSGPART